MTALQCEYRAMRAHLVDLRQEIHPAGTVVEVGSLPGTPWHVALAVAGSGNVPAAAIAERTAEWFRPRALLVVGIAGALHDDIQIGDVVVATWVYGYHGAYVGDRGLQARPRAWMASHRLEQLGRAVDRSDGWAGPATPAVHFRPVAAGEVVLNSRESPLARQLERHYSDAAAIEMESAGVATAGHLNDALHVLTIRGISDKADGTKHDTDGQGLQRSAAEHAAGFAAALLRLLPADDPASGREGAETSGGATWVQNIAGGPGGPVYVVQGGDMHVSGPPAAPAAAPRFTPVASPIPVRWRTELEGARAGSATLELHMVTADPHARLEPGRLVALSHELASVGRDCGLFDPAADIQSRATADVAKAVSDRSGLAVTREGQRSAWKPLPVTGRGTIFGGDDVLDRLLTLLAALVRADAPEPAEVGLAVAIDPATPVQRVRVRAEDTLPFDQLSVLLSDVAEELAARLFVAFDRMHDVLDS